MSVIEEFQSASGLSRILRLLKQLEADCVEHESPLDDRLLAFSLSVLEQLATDAYIEEAALAKVRTSGEHCLRVDWFFPSQFKWFTVLFGVGKINFACGEGSPPQDSVQAISPKMSFNDTIVFLIANLAQLIRDEDIKTASELNRHHRPVVIN